MAGLIVNTMVSTAEEILDVPVDRPEVEDEIVRTVERQLRLVALAVPHWRSAGRAPIFEAPSTVRRRLHVLRPCAATSNTRKKSDELHTRLANVLEVAQPGGPPASSASTSRPRMRS